MYQYINGVKSFMTSRNQTFNYLYFIGIPILFIIFYFVFQKIKSDL